MTAAERGIRRRQRLFVVFTAVLVLAYARQLVNAPTAGQDFRAFFAAAALAAQGGDPVLVGAPANFKALAARANGAKGGRPRRR